jgi:hypothetical protein
MSAMRERAAHRGRPRRRRSTPSHTPVDEAPREDALPLEDLSYDPETMPPPPSAKGSHPRDEEPAQDHPDDDAVGHDVLPSASTRDGAGDDGTTDDPEPAKRPARRKSGRPGVPSWDDVMFGSKPRE